MSNLARAAGLTGFTELALAVGLDAYKLAAEAGVPAAALSDPDMRVPAKGIDMMFEMAAERGGGHGGIEGGVG